MPNFRFNHLHVVCQDLQTMVEFWTDVLGGHLLERRQFGSADGATVDLGGVRIYLRLPKAGENVVARGEEVVTGYDHICLRTNDFSGAVKLFMDHDCRMASKPTCPGNSGTVFFYGPENILIELKDDDSGKRTTMDSPW